MTFGIQSHPSILPPPPIHLIPPPKFPQIFPHPTTHHLFDKMSSHQISSDRVLSVVVEHAIYPITVDVLNLLFALYGVEQLEVYPPTTSEDGEPCVAADVRFSSAHAAAQALACWDGHCIYYQCCRLQIWYATPDVLPAPTSVNICTSSASTAAVKELTVNINNATTDVCPEFAADLNYNKVKELTPATVVCSNKDEYTLEEATPEVTTSTPTCVHDLQSLASSLESTTEESGAVPDDATPTVTPTEVSPELASPKVCGAGHVIVAIDVQLPIVLSSTHLRYGPEIIDASLIPLVARPTKLVPLDVLSLQPDDVPQSDALSPVRYSTEYFVHDDYWVQPMPTLSSFSLVLPPSRKRIQQQPWPSSTQVQITETNDGLLQAKAHGCVTCDSGYVWWPPDQQPRRSETIHPHTHDGAKKMELSPQSVFLSSYEQFQWEIAWPLNFERNTTTSRPCCMHKFQFPLRATRIWGFCSISCVGYVLDGEQMHTYMPWPSFQPISNANCSRCRIISMQPSKSVDLRNATLSTMDYVILNLDQSGQPLVANTQFWPRELLFPEYHKICLYWRIWDPGWMFCCIIILGSGGISWYLHQMILSTLKNSVNCTQAKQANGYTYSVFSLHLSTSGTEIECRSSMLSIFGESLLHIHSVLLLLPWPPPPGAHGLQSTVFFTREFSCPFGTLLLPCFPSEQISCEADHSCWYLALLKLLAVQTVQNAAEACDSKSSMFASVVLLFGHKKSMSNDLNFLPLKSSSSDLLLKASNTASIVCALGMQCSCCLCTILQMLAQQVHEPGGRSRVKDCNYAMQPALYHHQPFHRGAVTSWVVNMMQQHIIRNLYEPSCSNDSQTSELPELDRLQITTKHLHKSVHCEQWCFYHPCHNCPAALLGLRKMAKLQVEQIWYPDVFLCGGEDHTHDLFKLELGSVVFIPILLPRGCLASYLCRTCTLALPNHFLFEVWITCMLSICIQMSMANPMAIGELNQWLAIDFLYGTLELDCRNKNSTELLGLVPTFSCQLLQSMGSGKICVLSTPGTPGGFTAVVKGYWISSCQQELFQGGRGVMALVTLVNQVNINRDYHHESDQVQEHRVQWDPGGRRLGVKPNFKEGGMLGPCLTSPPTGACCWANTWAGLQATNRWEETTS